MKYFFVILLGACLVFSCRFIGGKRVKGNGNVETEQRTVSTFDGVVSHGSFDITVVTGDAHSVKIEADENLLQYIDTDVEGGNLTITTRRGYNLRPRGELKVTVTAPHFNELSSHGSGNIKGGNPIRGTEKTKLHLSGSGNINVDLEAPAVDAEIAGSGNISVSGNTKQFTSKIYGSGDIQAANMNTEEGKVEIAGSGNVEISASQKLDVNIMGSGGVKYRGDAQVNTSIAGSGSVSRVN